MKKKNICYVLISILVIKVYSQECFFPPEFKYWENTISSIIPDFSTEKYVKNKYYIISYNDIENINSLITYPVFYRWNYSGTYFAYAFSGKIVNTQGRNKIIDNTECCLEIINEDKSNIIIDYDMYFINTYLWLRDNVLIVLGYREENKKIVLVYKKYIIENNENNLTICYVEEFTYKDKIEMSTFNNTKLNWYDYRDDYFLE